jgi:hypothetical protein
MSSHKIYGPWGKDKQYIWLDADEVSRSSDDAGLTIMVQPNISYASPIDGKPVTTWAKRKYDMESNGCMDAREGRACAADARRNWKTGLEGLTHAEMESYLSR